jgi:hypothetical protein
MLAITTSQSVNGLAPNGILRPTGPDTYAEMSSLGV